MFFKAPEMSQSECDVKIASRVMNSGLADESTEGEFSVSSLLFTHNHRGEQHAARRLVKGQGGRQASSSHSTAETSALTPHSRMLTLYCIYETRSFWEGLTHPEPLSAHLETYKLNTYTLTQEATHRTACSPHHHAAQHNPSERVFKPNAQFSAHSSWEIPYSDSTSHSLHPVSSPEKWKLLYHRADRGPDEIKCAAQASAGMRASIHRWWSLSPLGFLEGEGTVQTQPATSGICRTTPVTNTHRNLEHWHLNSRSQCDSFS